MSKSKDAPNWARLRERILEIIARDKIKIADVARDMEKDYLHTHKMLKSDTLPNGENMLAFVKWFLEHESPKNHPIDFLLA